MTLDVGKESTRPFSYTKTKMKIYNSTHFTLGCLPHNKDKKNLQVRCNNRKIYIPIVFMEIGATLDRSHEVHHILWNSVLGPIHRWTWRAVIPLGCSGFYHGLFQNVIGSPKPFIWRLKLALLIHVASENGGHQRKVKRAGSRLSQRRPEKVCLNRACAWLHLAEPLFQ
jgi:hypothetical protein